MKDEAEKEKLTKVTNINETLKEKENKEGATQIRLGNKKEYIIKNGGKVITRQFRLAIDVTNEPQYTVLEFFEDNNIRENCDHSILEELLKDEENN